MWGTTPAWLPTHSAQSSAEKPPSSLDVGGTDVQAAVVRRAELTEQLFGAPVHVYESH